MSCISINDFADLKYSNVLYSKQSKKGTTIDLVLSSMIRTSGIVSIFEILEDGKLIHDSSSVDQSTSINYIIRIYNEVE